MVKRFFNFYMGLAVAFLLAAMPLAGLSQTVKWQDLYKVKKKDTVYGIAKKYGITIEELKKANPGIGGTNFEIKKGDQLLIPVPASGQKKEPRTEKKAERQKDDKTIRVGVMLPLHNNDGDGRRMVEYYRGLLIACDSLKQLGASVEVNAWNVPIDADIRQSLIDGKAGKCNIIFGPLYTKQVKPLADYCRRNGIKLVIPFSISGNDVASNPEIFQVYQSPSSLSKDAIDAFMERFKGCQPVFIDCNDTTSRKGIFTFELRKRLEAKGIKYSITNLKSSETYFSKAFSRTVPNVVVLNTGRSPELNVALAKLDGLKAVDPSVSVSLFGYIEWLMYTKVYLEYFHKYDAYISTNFFYNPLSKRVKSFESSYRRWFKSDMRAALPRFALTGYDHGRFFIGGMFKYGKDFDGAKSQITNNPIQTPLKFKRISGGGMLNDSFMLVHYKRNHETELISY